MIYVMSDLHGCHALFRKMCEKINFSEADDLYILGDFVDRGDTPIPLLLDCMERINVYPLLGNHEAIMLQCVSGLPDEATPENVTGFYTPEGLEVYSAWMQNGGSITMTQYLSLPPKKREELLSYLREFRVFDELTMPDGRRIVLTHSGIEGFDPSIPLSEYPLDALINARPQQGDRFYDDRTLIFGHTPTLTYPEMEGRAEVLFAETYINIDCGAVFHEAGGKLACLRLDDMKVFYV
ncbi:MAG: metallophosphoesterase [Oscillospiraceae bacterium]|nr:metallophosphoesterase [Oscillospiraceae bacterium]